MNRSRLHGTAAIPASKSHTIRAIAIASLAEGESYIRNPLYSSDAASGAAAYRQLGADIDTSDLTVWVVRGTGGRIRPSDGVIDVGNSGTTLRLAIASAALAEPGIETSFTGDSQIQNRPLGPLLQSLRDLGAKAVSVRENDKAPVVVAGHLRGGRTRIECFTSQYLSSLLLAAPLAEQDTEIDVPLLHEPDYVRITLDWLDRQAIRYEKEDMRRFRIPGGQRFHAFDASVPADFSSATFFLCGAAMLEGSDVTLTGLDFQDSQPDKAVLDYLRRMGAAIEEVDNGVRVRGSRLRGVRIDMNRTPDALPAMAVTAAFAEGPTELVNVPQARTKETDRIHCMAEELTKLGCRVEELPDGLVIQPSGQLQATHLHGREDHRIVMALSLAGMALPGETTIETAEAMNVTFPTFVDLMKELGADMNLNS